MKEGGRHEGEGGGRNTGGGGGKLIESRRGEVKEVGREVKTK